MKQKFKYYIVAWAILVVIFNIIVFVTPNEVAGMSKFGGAFWVGYIFIMLIFIGQLGVAWYALKDDATKVFYRIPLLSISYGTLIAMLIIGILCMIIPNFPVWLGIILCFLVLAFSVVSMMQAQAAASIVGDIDIKIKNKAFFIKALTIDIDSLMVRSTTKEITDEIKKVYDAIRYSDPMSNEALSGVESQITLKVSELSESVEKSNVDMVQKTSREIQILLNDRNKKCKMLK